MTDVLAGVIADLTAESNQLRAAVVDADAWTTPTPAEGWDVATQIAHLLWTDEVATLAAGALTEEGKKAWDEIVLLAIEDPEGFVDKEALRLAELPPDELVIRWDNARTGLVDALRSYPEDQKLPWFGPPMSPTSMATARFMETWAHSLDVYDALGVPTGATSSAATDRIKHVAHIGVRTRDYSFINNELTPPTEAFHVELTAPSGETWTWGPADAEQRVSGSAYDFCQLVTQRIHRDDTDLVAVGEDAATWLTIAQCFAGPAGGGRDRRLDTPSVGAPGYSTNLEGDQ